MNKEQVLHWAKVLEEVALGQFLFFGGKNLYAYSTSYDFDWVVLGLSALIFIIMHVIIHEILSTIEEQP